MRKFIKIITPLILIAIAVVIFFQHKEYQKYKKIGENLINKVETYKSKYKKLPETLSDLNEIESMGIGPYYNKIDDYQYEISFCFGFDDYMTYNSKKQTWHSTE